MTIIKKTGKYKIYNSNFGSSHSFITNSFRAHEPKEADILIFEGGSDIGPNLYGEKTGLHTYPNHRRDKLEKDLFNTYRGKKPMIGICRGMQLLSVLLGHSLVQHINHPSRHVMHTVDNQIIKINSLHHQQVLLNEKKNNYKLLGWSRALSDYHLNGNEIDYFFKEDYKEPEAVAFEKENIVCFQYHPEMMSTEYFNALAWTKKMIETYIEI